MAISLEEVDRVGKLARLKFSDPEKQKLQQELTAILDYVDQLKEVKQTGGEELLDEHAPVNLMRDDMAEESINPEKLLEAAPQRENGFYKVKSVLE